MALKVEERVRVNALEFLRKDHNRVKQVFQQFDEAKDNGSKKRLVETALIELIIHTSLEEELFYPAARRELSNEKIMDEAAEEHHVAKLLIAELADMGPGDKGYEAKFRVLAGMVKHHIEEEEGDIFPKVLKSGINVDELGRELLRRRNEMIEEMETPDTLASMRRHGRRAKPTARKSSRHSRRR